MNMLKFDEKCSSILRLRKESNKPLKPSAMNKYKQTGFIEREDKRLFKTVTRTISVSYFAKKLTEHLYMTTVGTCQNMDNREGYLNLQRIDWNSPPVELKDEINYVKEHQNEIYTTILSELG